MKPWVALAIYAVIAIVAAFWIEGTLRPAIWILMAGLAAKTLVAMKMP